MSDDTPKPVTKHTVRTFLDPATLRRDVSYSLAGLSTAMSEQASLLIEYGRHQAAASRQVDDFELLLETTEAKLFRTYRQAAIDNGEKVVVSDLEKQVTCDSRVVAVKKALNEARQIEATCKTAVEAFRHRRDMLVQSGATEREELKGDLRMMRPEERDAEIADRKERFLAVRRASSSPGH